MAGQMDPQTEQALRKFQDFNNIQETGILDRDGRAPRKERRELYRELRRDPPR